MNLTKEQNDIISTNCSIRINAVAGSGKTTTIIEYAKTRPSNSRILYLAFNRSVRLEASRRFANRGVKNVKVETAHSLAYRHIMTTGKYRLSPQGYKSHELVDILQIKVGGEKHIEFILASHIGKCFSLYCNSDKRRFSEIDYLATASDTKSRSFILLYLNFIRSRAEMLFQKMERNEIEVTHDFYLKKFQLLQPKLDYDFILFDEGQDASPAMLDVFARQQCIKVIVGDTHQQIYGWRFAVNSLEKVDFIPYPLSTSFRCNTDISLLAGSVLSLKHHIGESKPFSMSGLGKSDATSVRAIIARSNLGLLKKAIAYSQDPTLPKKIYFEGNIHSYTYADEGASLYDVLNLYNHRHHAIRDQLIRSMKELYELEDYVEKTGDLQLGMMIDIVKEYGNEIPSILKQIKDMHVGDDEKQEAAVIFSTVHRCKGMEYDLVELVDDFITEEKLKKIKEDQKADTNFRAKTIEEINLLYVAVTRTRNKLKIPESMVPPGHLANDHVEIIPTPKPVVLNERPKYFLETLRDQKRARSEMRTRQKGTYRAWTPELDAELTEMFCNGRSISDMAKHFDRTSGAINSRIKRLDLYDLI